MDSRRSEVAVREAAQLSTTSAKSAPAVPSSSSGSAMVPLAFGTISLSRSQGMEILDHLGRAEQAARQCSKLCGSAAQAFLEEAVALSSAKAEVCVCVCVFCF